MLSISPPVNRTLTVRMMHRKRRETLQSMRFPGKWPHKVQMGVRDAASLSKRRVASRNRLNLFRAKRRFKPLRGLHASAPSGALTFSPTLAAAANRTVEEPPQASRSIPSILQHQIAQPCSSALEYRSSILVNHQSSTGVPPGPSFHAPPQFIVMSRDETEVQPYE